MTSVGHVALRTVPKEERHGIGLERATKLVDTTFSILGCCVFFFESSRDAWQIPLGVFDYEGDRGNFVSRELRAHPVEGARGLPSTVIFTDGKYKKFPPIYVVRHELCMKRTSSVGNNEKQDIFRLKMCSNNYQVNNGDKSSRSAIDYNGRCLLRAASSLVFVRDSTRAVKIHIQKLSTSQLKDTIHVLPKRTASSSFRIHVSDDASLVARFNAYVIPAR
ncbi:uncharacterized protein CLUP02_10522 [Colletotrichum lupini]|uniref:Uncharacterized protein n=1 Tax=Colletotrichum lupini TaxID=145971 RepID=A0A9Q8WIZ0_9PEZI|nr:uncharacterized protein CLUP02_10522 [Colletotrichum lupini]UQC85026.1 hypothetical protein CLUP02_10522 [Colletotrichum lupini]